MLRLYPLVILTTMLYHAHVFSLGKNRWTKLLEADWKKNSYFAFSMDGPPFFSVKGFDMNCRLELFRTDADTKSYDFFFENTGYKLGFFSQGGRFEITKQGVKLLEIPLAPFLAKLKDQVREKPLAKSFMMPQQQMVIESQSPFLRAKVFVYNISGIKQQDTFTVQHLKSDVLVGFIKTAASSKAHLP